METLIEIKKSRKFVLKNGVYCLNDNNITGDFEEIYLGLRKKENRLYDDETLKGLPKIASNHEHYKEWKIRENSAEKFLKYIGRTSKKINVLEIGCGNGWLTNMISKRNETEVIGLDINDYEIEQAARVFGNKTNILFLKADIFNKSLDEYKFDIIVLAGTIQYFNNFRKIIERLFEILVPDGEIHIFDSPFYQENYLREAKRNTQAYFTQIGFPQMAEHFHNHSYSELNNFNFSLLSNPTSLISRIKRRILLQSISPFYWVKIKR